MGQPQSLPHVLMPWAHSIATILSPRFWADDTSTDGWHGRGIGQPNQGWKFIDFWLQRVNSVKLQTGPNGLTYMELGDISINKLTDSALHDVATDEATTQQSQFDIDLDPDTDWKHDVLRSHTHTTTLASAKARAWQESASLEFGYAAGSAGGIQGAAKAAEQYGETLTDTATSQDAVTDAVHSILSTKGPGRKKISVISDIQPRSQLVSVDGEVDFTTRMWTDLDNLPVTAHDYHWGSWRDVLRPGLLGFCPADTSGSPWQGSTPMFAEMRAMPLTDHEKAMIAGPVRSLLTYEAPYVQVEIIEIKVEKV